MTEFGLLFADQDVTKFGLALLGPGSTVALSRRAHGRLVRMVFVVDVEGRVRWTSGATAKPEAIAFVQHQIAARYCPTARPRCCA